MRNCGFRFPLSPFFIAIFRFTPSDLGLFCLNCLYAVVAVLRSMGNFVFFLELSKFYSFLRVGHVIEYYTYCDVLLPEHAVVVRVDQFVQTLLYVSVMLAPHLIFARDIAQIVRDGGFLAVTIFIETLTLDVKSPPLDG